MKVKEMIPIIQDAMSGFEKDIQPQLWNLLVEKKITQEQYDHWVVSFANDEYLRAEELLAKAEKRGQVIKGGYSQAINDVASKWEWESIMNKLEDRCSGADEFVGTLLAEEDK